jgi:hypothetical protein
VARFRLLPPQFAVLETNNLLQMYPLPQRLHKLYFLHDVRMQAAAGKHQSAQSGARRRAASPHGHRYMPGNAGKSARLAAQEPFLAPRGTGADPSAFHPTIPQVF